ncbi:MAG TPA: hypothetical protein VFV50_16360 [Bdellovibrionales bacterium]|nr:hypothetical protein [Bdellovibrionales bacterium]
MDLTLLLDETDRDIRKGRLGAARQKLRSLDLKKLRRGIFARVANLARRAGLPHISVRLLNPIVRPKRIMIEPAGATEIAEYAAALIDAGAVDEGLQLLRALDSKKDPQILLYQAFGMFTRWDYAGAVPLLKAYINTTSNTYQALVGKVNLAASLVTLGHASEAKPLLRELLELTKAEGHLRLHGNCLELSAQMHFGRGEFAKAKAFLARASEALDQSGGLDEFFVNKWNTFLEMAERPVEPQDYKSLGSVKAIARRKHHWEGIRDCDFFLAKKLNDRALLTHLFYSTPHEGFKNRVRAVLTNIPQEYIWNVKKQLKRPPAYFDLATATDSRSGAQLKPGQLLHRCMTILASDYYQPMRVATLFANLYPNEYYDPETSPFRVHQALERSRKWFLANGIPLAIREHRGFYFLSADSSYGIRKILANQSPLEIKLMELLRAVSGTEFTAAEVARLSGKPLRSVQRLIQEGLNSGLLTSHGDTWTRTYSRKLKAAS